MNKINKASKELVFGLSLLVGLSFMLGGCGSGASGGQIVYKRWAEECNFYRFKNNLYSTEKVDKKYYNGRLISYRLSYTIEEGGGIERIEREGCGGVPTVEDCNTFETVMEGVYVYSQQEGCEGKRTPRTDITIGE